MVRWRDILDDARLRVGASASRSKPSRHVAHYQIRNRGTVGGSLAHADPAAEMPGIAVACDAEIAVVSKAGGANDRGRATYFLGPLMTALEPDEDRHRNSSAAVGPGSAASALRNSLAAAAISPVAGAALFYDQDGGGNVEAPTSA